MHYTIEAMIFAAWYPNYLVAQPLSLVIDDIQTIHGELSDTPIGTNPTHSQLAKDHDTHHFHELAAKLAMYAVEKVGEQMFEYFEYNRFAINPIEVAKSFIVHPDDLTKLDRIISDWADENPELLKRGTFKHGLEHLYHQMDRAIDELTPKIELINRNVNHIKQKIEQLLESF
jgi:hypothetical protein